MENDSNLAPAGTAEPSALSVDEAADRLASMFGGDPEPEAPAEDTNAEAAPAEDDTEAPDPDDWDTPDAEDEASDEPEAEVEQPDQPREQGRFVGDDAKVKLADGRVVTVGELRSGSMMMSDYTRKTQELAAQRKAVEAETTAIKQLEATLTQQRELALALLQDQMPVKPDLALLNSDPIGYLQAQADYEAKMGKLQGLMSAKQQQEALAKQESDRAYQDRLKSEVDKFLEKVPELRNPEKFKRFHGEMADKFQSAYGISQDELFQVGDHRFVLMMRDALRYQRIQANKGKAVEKVQGKPPVAKPGRRQSPEANAAREREASKNRLRQSGRLSDGAAAIFDILNRK